jgi:hypothetical protein
MDVISTKLIEGRPSVRVYSPQDPMNGFRAVEPNLEDMFFYQIKQNSRTGAAA